MAGDSREEKELGFDSSPSMIYRILLGMFT